MTPEQRSQYRAVGGRLAAYVRQLADDLPPSASLQAVVSDLVGNNGELALPLKDLVSRPGFRSLTRKAGSGSGSLERNALLQSMQATFSLQVIEALVEMLSGFLDLPSGSCDPHTTAEKRRGGSMGRDGGMPIRVSVESSAQQPIFEPPALQRKVTAPPRKRMPILAGVAGRAVLAGRRHVVTQ